MVKAGQQRRFEMESTQEEKLNSVDVRLFPPTLAVRGIMWISYVRTKSSHDEPKHRRNKSGAGREPGDIDM